MTITGRRADRFLFAALYLVTALVVIEFAGRIADRVLDTRFYRTCLQPWQMRLTALRHQPVAWPAYAPGDPVGYMRAVTAAMQAKGVQPPQSNTEHGFIYRLRRFGAGGYQILLVYRDNHLEIFGLPADTFERLDRIVDGRIDPGAGDLTGRWSADGVTRIARWNF